MCIVSSCNEKKLVQYVKIAIYVKTMKQQSPSNISHSYILSYNMHNKYLWLSISVLSLTYNYVVVMNIIHIEIIINIILNNK